jgi:hypothetical protein
VADKKTCFVIGPIGNPETSIRAAADDFMEYIVKRCLALKEFGYGDPIRADMLPEPGRITSQVIKLLVEADLVIADLTNNNANVCYELSLRHAVGKPAIHMAVADTQISFDLYDNRTIFYTMHSRIVEAARDELAKQIRRVHEPGYKATNPITEAVGIINLERSSDPVQQAIGALANQVASLSAEISSLRPTLRHVETMQATNNNILTGAAAASTGIDFTTVNIAASTGLNLSGHGHQMAVALPIGPTGPGSSAVGPAARKPATKSSG